MVDCLLTNKPGQLDFCRCCEGLMCDNLILRDDESSYFIISMNKRDIM